MKMKRALILLFVFVSSLAWAQVTVPPLWGHSVHDEAHVLSQQAIDHLEVMLKKHEDSTTNQIAVLILSSLQGESLEELALRVAHDEWKLGQQEKDNGVLLLIAIDDRKIRIEVGYGLEGVLPDAITARIIRNEIAPHFRSQDYEKGIIAGVQAIIQAIDGEFVAEADNHPMEMTQLSGKEKLLIGAFVFGILGIFTLIGLFVPGCSGWFMYAFLIPFWAAFPMVVLGVNSGIGVLATYILGFPVLKMIVSKTAWGKRMATNMGNKRSGKGWSSGSGWFGGGGFSSSRGGGWSSGGGGFSGGGGGFGGGGSSGSW